MTTPCVDNYVNSCNPAPKTPASEVIVARTHHPNLAVTGADVDPTWVVVAVIAVAVGGWLMRFGRKKARG